MCGALWVSALSRSPVILAAAAWVGFSWVSSIAVWFALSGRAQTISLLIVDLFLAGVFFFMSRGRWFPVPLFFLHAGMVFYHANMWWIQLGDFWFFLLLNRAFELELLYLFGCGFFRLYARARKSAEI